jgi:hypothetical protein
MDKDVINIAGGISLIGSNTPEAKNDGFRVVGSSFFYCRNTGFLAGRTSG